MARMIERLYSTFRRNKRWLKRTLDHGELRGNALEGVSQFQDRAPQERVHGYAFINGRLEPTITVDEAMTEIGIQDDILGAIRKEAQPWLD